VLGAIPLEAFIDKFIAYDSNGAVVRDITYRRILSDIGGDVSATPPLVADYVNGFGSYCRPPADLFPTLTRLRADGLRLGIVTNGQVHIQEHTLAGLGLSEAFDVILISESEGIRKPDPAIFLRALERLAVAPAAAVFVGDNPQADIVGAKAAEMRAIWMANKVYPPPSIADATISTLSELPAAIAGC
jgi:putative hydrolase of the HAD superfamily